MTAEALVGQMRAAVAAQRRGDLAGAIAGYQRVLSQEPRFPEAHNNLAVALKAAGRLEDALASFRQALSLRPAYPAALANLSGTLLQLGRHRAALRPLLQALRLEPGKASHLELLAEILRPIRFSAAGADVQQAVEACFDVPNLDHQPIVPAALSLLRADPTIASAFQILASEGAAGLAATLHAGRLDGLFGLSLLQRVLCQTLMADGDFEHLLTVLRRSLLDRVLDSKTHPTWLPFLAALAHQCFLTDYAYEEKPAETASVTALERHLAGATPNPHELATLALYRPLWRLPLTEAKAGEHAAREPILGALLRQQVSEPLREQSIAAQLATLTPIGNPVSQAVQAQYEEHPYPRWQRLRTRPPRPLPDIAAALLPGLDPLPPRHRPTRILVAGCGTGRHALAVATRYSDAEVLAVDLSRTSLAYAQRKAEEAGLRQVRFAQADLLALGGLEQRFDLIECSGVLHHLDDPLAGWNVLVKLLAKDGLMKIGLYSRLSRRHLQAARDWLQGEGQSGDPAALRTARQELLALDPAHPAAGAMRELDFYSLSGCRDLLFHTQETSYDLGEIAAMIERLGLDFLGFEFVDAAVTRAFRQRHSDPADLTNLARWQSFEAEAPDAFRQMYQFWCRPIV